MSSAFGICPEYNRSMVPLPRIFECSVCHRVLSGRFGVSPDDRSIWLPSRHVGITRRDPCPGNKLEAIITDQEQFGKIKHLLRKSQTEIREEDLARWPAEERPFIRAIQLANLRGRPSDIFQGDLQAVVDKYVSEMVAEPDSRESVLKAALSQCLDALDVLDLPEESMLYKARTAAREALEIEKK